MVRPTIIFFKTYLVGGKASKISKIRVSMLTVAKNVCIIANKINDNYIVIWR